MENEDKPKRVRVKKAANCVQCGTTPVRGELIHAMVMPPMGNMIMARDLVLACPKCNLQFRVSVGIGTPIQIVNTLYNEMIDKWNGMAGADPNTQEITVEDVFKKLGWGEEGKHD